MTIGEHIDELRTRIVRCLFATVIAAIGVFAFHGVILDVILAPAWSALDSIEGAVLTQTEIGEGFLTSVRVSIIVALFLVSPYIAWQIWGFVGAGLFPHEQRYVKIFAVPTYVLFLAGVSFSYFIVMPFGLEFLLEFLGATPAGEQMENHVVRQYIGMGDYVGFFLTINLVMGFVFQLPLLMVALDRIGIVTVTTFRNFRRHFLLAAFIIGAILTPPDPVTQISVAGALIVLFEFGIWFSVFTGGGRIKAASDSTERKDG